MDAETTQMILVILLSVTLALFLTLSLVAVIKIIQLVNVLKRIAERAEHIADKAEHIGDMFQKTAGPVALGRFLAHLTDTVLYRNKSKKRGK